MQGMRTANLPDGGLGPASDAAAADGVVLDHLPRGHPYTRSLGGAAPTPVRDQLRDGLLALHGPTTYEMLYTSESTR